MVRVAIDGGGYSEACDGFYDANHAVVEAVSALASSLDGCGSMAGTDTGGEAWAAQYDPAAAQAVQAGCDLAASIGTIGNLLNASLVNHDGADGGAMLAGPPEVTGQDTGDHDANHYAEELSTSAPPSAKGGTGDQPGWWHWIASHVEGLLWPDADTDQLRAAGSAWIKAGQAVEASQSEVDAATGLVSSQTSPEIKDAVAACQEISGHVAGLASAYQTVGKACNDYADDVDEHRKQVEDELKSFIEWTIGIETAGAIVGFFTAGIGEGAAQAVEASKVAQAAAKVIGILKKLIELAEAVAETIGTALKSIVEIAGKLPKFLTAVIDRALIKLGIREAEQDGKLLWTSWANYEKVTKDGREYAKIGDRLYSHHAVDRLQPSGLGAPAGAVGAGRSVSPNFVEHILSTVKGEKTVLENGEVRYIFNSGDLRVITSDDGIVITVMRTSR